MGAAMNGMALHGGVLPVGGTFFVFSDYMRPRRPPGRAVAAPRSSSSGRHDSVGLGEDGPDPPADRAARLAAGHARPARDPPGRRQRDGAGWRVPSTATGPTALILTRQKRARARGHAPSAPTASPGAPTCSSRRSPATPTSCSSAPAARSRCASRPPALLGGRASRPGSCRCRRWELFEAQPTRTRSGCCRPTCPTLAVEAGRHLRLGALGRRRDRHRPLRCLGAGDVALEHLGFTAGTWPTGPGRCSPPAGAAAGRPTAALRPGAPPPRGPSSLDAVSPIARLNEFGQSPWYDNLAGPLLAGGDLARWSTRTGSAASRRTRPSSRRPSPPATSYDDAAAPRVASRASRSRTSTGSSSLDDIAAPPTSCGRSTTRRRRRRLRVDRGRPPSGPRHRRHHRPGRAICTTARTGPTS